MVRQEVPVFFGEFTPSALAGGSLINCGVKRLSVLGLNTGAKQIVKAALLLHPEGIEIGDAENPRPLPGEVIIRPELVGVCGTDVSFYRGHRTVPYPFVLGHEMAGRVSALGAGVTKLFVGQRVIVEPNYPCGSCRLCETGHGAICPEKKSMGVNIPGCLSTFASAPAKFVWPVPDSISDADAATIEPLAVSMHGLEVSGCGKGETVCVLGCGVVGLLLIHAAKASGLQVIAHDRFAEKLEMARRLGAETASHQEDAADLWQAANVSTVFECAGTSATVELALKAAPRGAQVVLLGLSSSPASFIPMRLVREGINVRTSMIYDHPADFARVIDLVARGELKPSCIVTGTFPFESTAEALRLASTGESGKIHIRIK
jgi:L-iditol 2-dehydrogenase